MDLSRSHLEDGIDFTKPVIKRFIPGASEFVFDVKDERVLTDLGPMPGVQLEIRTKESGKKAVMALLAKQELSNNLEALAALDLGGSFSKASRQSTPTTESY